MKKLLLISLFAITINFSKAQSWVYHPLPNDSLVWLEHYQDWEGTYHYYVKEMLGDTTIGSYTYKKLFQSSWWASPVYVPPVYVYYTGAVRQDVPNKRVYEINTFGVETLLYDFNKVVGDTMAILEIPVTDTLYVQSIDSVLVGTSYHKRFNLISSIGFGAPSPLVEGVGNEAGFGNWYTYGFEFGNNLWCFSHQNVQLFPNGSSMSCHLTVGIAELSGDKIKIEVMPNPTAGQVNLTVGCHDTFSLELQELSGKVLERRENQSNVESSIDLSAYPAGIYLIRLINNTTGDSVSKKVVKK